MKIQLQGDISHIEVEHDLIGELAGAQKSFLGNADRRIMQNLDCNAMYAEQEGRVYQPPAIFSQERDDLAGRDPALWKSHVISTVCFRPSLQKVVVVYQDGRSECVNMSSKCLQHLQEIERGETSAHAKTALIEAVNRDILPALSLPRRYDTWKALAPLERQLEIVLLDEEAVLERLDKISAKRDALKETRKKFEDEIVSLRENMKSSSPKPTAQAELEGYLKMLMQVETELTTTGFERDRLLAESLQVKQARNDLMEEIRQIKRSEREEVSHPTAGEIQEDLADIYSFESSYHPPRSFAEYAQVMKKKVKELNDQRASIKGEMERMLKLALQNDGDAVEDVFAFLGPEGLTQQSEKIERKIRVLEQEISLAAILEKEEGADPEEYGERLSQVLNGIMNIQEDAYRFALQDKQAQIRRKIEARLEGQIPNG